MGIRGWVYIITNKAMPDLVKVGYSTKDPQLRAAELNHTGTPHPYLVQFDMLIENPREIEQLAHAHLSEYREGKEWFRCSVDQAVSAIQFFAGKSQLVNNRNETRNSGAEHVVDSPQFVTATVIEQRRVRHIATYAGTCSHCGTHFTVTLSPFDIDTRCPECFRLNGLSTFRERRLVI